MKNTSQLLILITVLSLFALSACSDDTNIIDGDTDNFEDDNESMDGDLDNETLENETLETDGDLTEEEQEIIPEDEQELEPPEEQPTPDGEADFEYLFNQKNLSLKDWRVRDKADDLLGLGSSHWTVIHSGLVQWADMGSTLEPEPDQENSDFLSSEIRNELQPLITEAIELDFTVGETSGGIGFSFNDGEEKILVCLDETFCGSKFARWQSSGETIALSENDLLFTEGERHQLLLTVQDGFGMVSLDDSLLLTVPFENNETGTAGIINYMMKTVTIHSISFWGGTSGTVQRPNVDWAVVAHRGHGNSREANALPENTTEACQQGFDDGADYLEIDLLLSKDGVPVLMHDGTLDRTTNCTGNVEDKTLEELKACQIIEDGSSYVGDPIFVPSFEDSIKAVQGAKWFVELKGTGSSAGNEQLASTVVSLMQQYNLDANSYIISFSLSMLEQVELIDSNINTAYVVSSLGDNHISDAIDANLDALDVGYLFVDEQTVTDIHDAGLKIFIWTADNQSEFENYIALGVDGITTNNADRLAATAYAK